MIEFALATVLTFTVITTVWALHVAPAIAELGSPRGELSVAALVVAIVLFSLVLSPWGRRSGAHMNPAVTLALWLMRAFPGRDVAGYVIAQLAGSIVGTGLGRLVWGRTSGLPPVNYGVALPSPAWNWSEVALAEASGVAVIVLVVGFLLSMPSGRSRGMVPYAVSLLVAANIVVLGPLSGGSSNPARQFGPALWSGQTADLAVYLIAPMIGGAVGAVVHRAIADRRLHTHKLCGSAGPSALDASSGPVPIKEAA
ncbi:MIP/aquaporin family protein [Streptomyces sp. NBC_00258]|uniref:MIP/aquaporin family protein n=1 Tax=Streptomyces sp. NBC_00258 TaxID=2903642 RepID=UPI002E2B3FDD|nr:aquaporin [Streptomyces sp. NBC_00258]